MQIQPPNRVQHSYVQRLEAAPEVVFPLLCPVREAEWLEGWDPRLVLTDSGFAEEGCVFVTQAEPDDAIWFITRHEAGTGCVEMVKITPQVTACRLRIELANAPHGCDATVTYSHTSLGPAGDEFVAAFNAAYYLDFMQAWERAMNHFLRTGTLLRGD